MREGDLDTKSSGDLLVPGELPTSVRRDGQHPRTISARHLGYRFGHLLSRGLIDMSHQEKPDPPLHKRHQRSLMRSADDRVDLPVADAGSLIDDRRSNDDWE